MTASGNIEISASLEDYLEAIFRLIRDKNVARSKDVAQRLNVRRSSVTGALQALAERELVNYEPYEAITLTKKGHDLAEAISERHGLLQEFFYQALDLNHDIADNLACKLEHVLSDNIVKRLQDFVRFARECPRGALRWSEQHGFTRERRADDLCEKCVNGELDLAENAASPAEARLTLAAIKPGGTVRVVKIAGGGVTRRRRFLGRGLAKHVEKPDG